MTRELRRDDELLAPGEDAPRWQVLDSRQRYGRIKLLDCQAHRDVYMDVSEIIDAVVSGELFVRRRGMPLCSAAAQGDPAHDERLRIALGVLHAVQALQRLYGLSFSKAYERARDQKVAQGEGDIPSRPTLYRYAEAQRNGLPILRGNANKGNRSARYDQRIVQLICDVAEGQYLQQGSRWTLRSLTEYVNARAREYGWLDTHGKISRTFVAKTIYENESVDPEIDRMDPKFVSAAKSVARHRIMVTAPFERVEQDALHLPFVVDTPHGPASNVYLIHAIDCGTGAPCGWALKVGAPTASDSLRCVQSILFPKREILAGLGIKTTLDVHGTPHLLVYDNGAEARNERMFRLVRLDIDAKHCRSREAQGKPYIERLNKSLKLALETLNGCTRFNGKDGERDPIALGDKLMTLEELERWLVRWYYESWSNNPLKRHLRSDFVSRVKLGSTPAERWTRMTSELAFALPLPPSLTEWRMTVYDHEIRKLNRKSGVTYRGFNYRGANLTYLIDKYAERPVKVLADPDDFREVFVDDGELAPLVPLVEEFVDDSTPAYSFKEAEEMRRALAQVNAPGADIARQFREDVQNASIQSTSDKRRKKRQSERNREVADKTAADQAVRRAAAKPLHAAPAAASPMRPQSSFTDTAPGFSLDDLPALAVRDRVSGDGVQP